MCNYTGRHFGASYHDAVCIDGFLWDLDSEEDGMLTSGGSDPCPNCNGRTWLEAAAEEVASAPRSEHGFADGFVLWEMTVKRLLRDHPKTAQANLIAFGQNTIMDADTGDTRTWPWIMEGISAHLAVAILAGRRGDTDNPEISTTISTQDNNL